MTPISRGEAKFTPLTARHAAAPSGPSPHDRDGVHGPGLDVADWVASASRSDGQVGYVHDNHRARAEVGPGSWLRSSDEGVTIMVRIADDSPLHASIKRPRPVSSEDLHPDDPESLADFGLISSDERSDDTPVDHLFRDEMDPQDIEDHRVF